MSGFILSILANVFLIILVLTLVYPKVYKVYMNKKKQRELHLVTKRKEEIRKIVIEYLEELKNE